MPSKYNEFMKTEIANVKKLNATLTHKEAFSKAASNWTAKKNEK
jgi:hypothetical protein